MTEKQTTGRKTAKKKSSEDVGFSSRNADNFRLELKPMQKPIVNLHRENDIVILMAPPGSGKDFMQIYRAVSGLINKEFEEVIFMRTVVEAVSTKIGFLPGSEEDKVKDYIEIFYDQMRAMLKPHIFDKLKNKVRFEYPGFIRGKTFGGNDKGNVCIVFSEGQNATLKELCTISTRLAEGSKLFISADPLQSDIGRNSGIVEFANMVKHIDGICVKELDDSFQMRGRLVREIDNAYREHLKSKK